MQEKVIFLFLTYFAQEATVTETFPLLTTTFSIVFSATTELSFARYFTVTV